MDGWLFNKCIVVSFKKETDWFNSAVLGPGNGVDLRID